MYRRKATTEKIPLETGLLSEAKLNFQRKLKGLQMWHDIPDDLILNFKQTPVLQITL